MFRIRLLIFFFTVFAHNGLAFDFADIKNAILNAENVVHQFTESYDMSLPKDDVVHIYCANYTDKVFVRVFFDDPDIAIKVNVSNQLAFLIHGWISSDNANWMIEVGETWVQNYDTNVCRFGWGNFSRTDYVTAATKHVKMVAGYITSFIQFLNVNYSVPFESITILGHSLGAHVAGDIGFNIRPSKLKRIVGADPAGPLFTNPIKISTDFRLDVSDAKSVIIIHTTDGVLGLGVPCGHQDFYPDKGLIIQPGCFPNLYGSYGDQKESISCSHIRAVRMFHNSLVPGNNCVARKSNNLMSYLFNQHDDVIVPIEPYSEITAEGLFFMKSDGKGGCSGNF